MPPKASVQHFRRFLGAVSLAGLAGSFVLWGTRMPVWAETLVLKQGELQVLPPLQTRSRPPLPLVKTLYLGMLEDRFLEYANTNNWQLLSVSRPDRHWIRWEMVPGGEALLPIAPTLDPTYARGFLVQAYFIDQRLAGLHLRRDPSEPGFDMSQLRSLVNTWFPDNSIQLQFQVLPEDTTHQVLAASLGQVPIPFQTEVSPIAVPICHAVLTPSPVLSAEVNGKSTPCDSWGALLKTPVSAGL